MNTIIKRFVQQLKISLNMDFWKTLISTLGAVSAVVTLISFVVQVRNPSSLVITFYFIIVLGGSLIISWLLTRRKSSLELELSNTFTIKVDAGDLFDNAEGTNYVVIPVNEYFDTVVNTKIVNASLVFRYNSWYQRPCNSRWFKYSCLPTYRKDS